MPFSKEGPILPYLGNSKTSHFTPYDLSVIDILCTWDLVGLWCMFVKTCYFGGNVHTLGLFALSDSSVSSVGLAGHNSETWSSICWGPCTAVPGDCALANCTTQKLVPVNKRRYCCNLKKKKKNPWKVILYIQKRKLATFLRHGV